MRDVIRIEGIEFQAFVGIYPHEHELRQPIVVDLAFYLDLQDAGRNENFSETIDYERAAKLTQEIIEDRHYKLVETVAEKIANKLKDEYGPKLHKLRVRVAKPRALLQARSVVIEIER